MKKPYCRMYPEVEKPYIEHDIKGSYLFQTEDEVNRVLGIEIKKTKGFWNLPDDKRVMFILLFIRFLNGFGLEFRDTVWPISVIDISERKFFKFTYKRNNGKGYVYLYYNGVIG